MANEMVIETWRDYAESIAVADGTGIEVGTLLKATDNNTGIISSAQADPLSGVCSREKIASDGRLKSAVYKRGRVRATLSGAASTGDALCSYADANYPNVLGVAAGVAAASGAAIFGTAAMDGADGERIVVDMNIGGAS